MNHLICLAPTPKSLAKVHAVVDAMGCTGWNVIAVHSSHSRNQAGELAARSWAADVATRVAPTERIWVFYGQAWPHTGAFAAVETADAEDSGLPGISGASGRALYGDSLLEDRSKVCNRPRFSAMSQLACPDYGQSLVLTGEQLVALVHSGVFEGADLSRHWSALTTAFAFLNPLHLTAALSEYSRSGVAGDAGADAEADTDAGVDAHADGGASGHTDSWDHTPGRAARGPQGVFTQGVSGTQNASGIQQTRGTQKPHPTQAERIIEAIGAYAHDSYTVGSAVGKVSVIIPSIGSFIEAEGESVPALFRCLESLESTTQNVAEVVLVSGDRMPEWVREEAQKHTSIPIRHVHAPGEFNFSFSCNLGASLASQDCFLFLNDDVEATGPGWLDEMCRVKRVAQTGAVGAKLLFPDGTIQHCGIVINPLCCEPNHLYMHKGSEVSDPVAHRIAAFTAVTGACLLVDREAFEKAGGFSEDLPSNYNDVDLCLKLQVLGYTNVSCNNVSLIHRESLSRVPTVHDFELEAMRKWRPWILKDPYVNVWGV